MILFIAASFDKNLFSFMQLYNSIKMLNKFAGTLAGYKAVILACRHYRISSVLLEGTNNKIKTIKLMAYGFRWVISFSWISHSLRRKSRFLSSILWHKSQRGHSFFILNETDQRKHLSVKTPRASQKGPCRDR